MFNWVQAMISGFCKAQRTILIAAYLDWTEPNIVLWIGNSVIESISLWSSGIHTIVSLFVWPKSSILSHFYLVLYKDSDINAILQLGIKCLCPFHIWPGKDCCKKLPLEVHERLNFNGMKVSTQLCTALQNAWVHEKWRVVTHYFSLFPVGTIDTCTMTGRFLSTICCALDLHQFTLVMSCTQ